MTPPPAEPRSTVAIPTATVRVGCEASVCGVAALGVPGGPIQVPFRVCCAAALLRGRPEVVVALAEVVGSR